DGGSGGEGVVRVHWALDVEPGARDGVRWEGATDLRPTPGAARPLEETPARLARSGAGAAVDARESPPRAWRGLSGSGGGRRPRARTRPAAGRAGRPSPSPASPRRSTGTGPS